MKKRSKFSALFLAAVLSVSITACGSSENDTKKNTTSSQSTVQDEKSDSQKNDVDPFVTAKKNMADVSSLNGKMTMEMNMVLEAGGETQTFETVTSTDMTYFSDPLHMKADVTVDSGENGTISTTIYAEAEEDGTYTMYQTDGTSWQSQSVPLDYLSQYNASNNMAEYLNDSYPYEEDGTEQIYGKNAYKYTAVLTGNEIKQALESSGALDTFGSSLGMDESQLEGMTDDLGNMPVSLWIDEESLYPVKYEIDMTSIMDKLISSITESMAEEEDAGLSMKIPKMTLSMTCSDYNAAKDFTIPEEAKADTAAAES